MDTRAQFEARMCQEGGITLERYRQQFVSLPCSCEVATGPHWAKLRLGNDASMILDHLTFHCPTMDELIRMDRVEHQNEESHG